VLYTDEEILRAIGRVEDLPVDVRRTLQETIQKTETCNGMTLNLALSYGGRSEILHAVQTILGDCQKGLHANRSYRRDSVLIRREP
jgi:undecaprenyl diphosphate synthase